MENKQQKLYINGFPVWRTELEDVIEYILFENNRMISSVININKGIKDLTDEYKIILEGICEETGYNNKFKYGVRVRYENKL